MITLMVINSLNSSLIRDYYWILEISVHRSVKCCCRKMCNGIRGLKMHQRTCRVAKDLTEETFELVEENLTGSYNNDKYNEDIA